MSLPKYFIIQSTHNDKYLHLDFETPGVPNALAYTGEYSYGLETRFQMEPATTTGTGLVHIRSVQNNKYWAYFGGPYSALSAMADKPEEVQSNPHCTLFKPVLIEDGVFQLCHVSTGQYVGHFFGGQHHGVWYPFLCLTDKGRDPDRLIVLDWESILVLPKLIRITGGQGNHLMVNRQFMTFQYGDDDLSHVPPSVYEYEVCPSRNGGIRLKNAGKYWYDVPDTPWVELRDASETDHALNTVFVPMITDGEPGEKEKQGEKIKGNFILMKSLRSNKFCTQIDAEDKQSCLAATVDSYPDKWCIFKIEEPIVSRTITGIQYHLNDARIYEEEDFTADVREYDNHSDEPSTLALDFKHTDIRTTNWNASVSYSFSLTMSVSVGVPLIEEEKFEISYKFSGKFEWGATDSKGTEIGSKYTVTIPPRSKVKASMMATRGMCEIPFSYTQRVLMTDGTVKHETKDDGVFIGKNAYNFRYEADQYELNIGTLEIKNLK